MSVMKKEFSNLVIYNLASALLEHFNTSLNLPVKTNFYFQKNVTNMVALAKEIEQHRFDILEKYGTKNEETNQYEFANEIIDTVNNEITELLDLTQEVTIYPLSLDEFGDLVLSTEQVQAISFMFNEEE